MDFKDGSGNVGRRRITGDERRPGPQPCADGRIGLKFHVGDGKVSPVVDFFGGTNLLQLGSFTTVLILVTLKFGSRQ